VVVQEDFTYHLLLVASVQHPYRSPPKPIGSRPVNDGLNQLSILPFHGLERVQWASCYGIFDHASDCLAEKGFTYSRLELAPGIEVDLYNLHAEAGGSLFDETARADNYSQLAAFITTRSAGRALIVAGDMNLHGFDPVDEPVLQAFLGSTGLADACRTLGCPVETIDRVLLRSTPALTLRPVGHRIATEFVDAAGQDLSDHEAIHVDIEWATVP
ncbi:MAG: endonuclease, partial [Actinobacteria bacterium]|nr:endonuclease [Actinomycetota bacterium]